MRDAPVIALERISKHYVMGQHVIKAVDAIDSIAPIMYTQLGGQVRYGSQTTGAQILGTTYSYRDVGQRYNAAGRFISDSDDETRRRVAVIAADVRADLALPGNPVGEFLQINGEWIKIVGLLEARGDILGRSQDNQILLPYRTVQSLAGSRRQPDIFLLEALVLCLFGGFIGLMIGYGIGALAAALIPGLPPAYTPLWAVAIALGFSGLVGVVFGILPAAKAGNLDPISSLRYE